MFLNIPNIADIVGYMTRKRNNPKNIWNAVTFYC